MTEAETETLAASGHTARHGLVQCSLGEITLSARGASITGLYFPDHWHPPTPEALGERVETDHDHLLSRAAQQLEEYLSGDRREFDLPISTSGDAFSERVWGILRTIPYGERTTYGALAAELGDPHLAQRVGSTVGRNPVCILIPCHRVIGSDGSLTGYAGGIERKRMMLELEEPEAEAASRLF